MAALPALHSAELTGQRPLADKPSPRSSLPDLIACSAHIANVLARSPNVIGGFRWSAVAFANANRHGRESARGGICAVHGWRHATKPSQQTTRSIGWCRTTNDS